MFDSSVINDYAVVRTLAATSFLKWTDDLDPSRVPLGVTVRAAYRESN